MTARKSKHSAHFQRYGKGALSRSFCISLNCVLRETYRNNGSKFIDNGFTSLLKLSSEQVSLKGLCHGFSASL